MSDRFQSQWNELQSIFAEHLDEVITRHVSAKGCEDVQVYLADLLLKFQHTDQIFAVKNSAGDRLISVTEMLPEGDVRLNAESFDRERQVHRHIGDFILFWAGVYPEFLRHIKLDLGKDIVCDYPRQARESYGFVSTFTLPPYDDEAPTFRKLSDGFDDFAFCLQVVGQRLRLNA